MSAEIVFTFPDARNAMDAERILLDNGVPVRVMSRPSALGEGCGICLRVDPDKRDRAETVLRNGGIQTGGVFSKRRENGRTLYQAL